MPRSFLLGLLLVGACSKHEAPPAPKEAASASVQSAALPAAPPPPPAPEPAKAAPRSLGGKKVLHVGDSMVGGNFGLTKAFEAKLKDEGATLVRHTKVSESMSSFEKGPTLKDLLRTHDPDIVVITLGANDALVPHPEVFAQSVEKIVKRVGDRECWWIGPPMWREDSGIVRVIQENSGKCRFFDSSKLELERTADGIHPTDRGGAKWADAFWDVFHAG